MPSRKILATSESCTTRLEKSLFVELVAEAVEARSNLEFCRICEAR